MAVRTAVEGFRENLKLQDRPLFLTGCSCERALPPLVVVGAVVPPGCHRCCCRGRCCCRCAAGVLWIPPHTLPASLPVCAAGGSLALRLPGFMKIDGVMSGG